MTKQNSDSLDNKPSSQPNLRIKYIKTKIVQMLIFLESVKFNLNDSCFDLEAVHFDFKSSEILPSKVLDFM